MTILILSWKLIMQTRKRESVGIVINKGKVPECALLPKSAGNQAIFSVMILLE
jgi:hypothetical protein